MVLSISKPEGLVSDFVGIFPTSESSLLLYIKNSILATFETQKESIKNLRFEVCLPFVVDD